MGRMAISVIKTVLACGADVFLYCKMHMARRFLLEIFSLIGSEFPDSVSLMVVGLL